MSSSLVTKTGGDATATDRSLREAKNGKHIDERQEKKKNEDNDDEIQIYAEMLQIQMAPLRVETANRIGDHKVLEDAIREIEKMPGKKPDCYEPAIAVHHKIMNLEKGLRQACQERNRQKILNQLAEIKRSENETFGYRFTEKPRMSLYLKKSVDEAQKLVDYLADKEKDTVPQMILAMDRKTMTEIKSYVKPSPLIHRVMQAVFLLFDEDEEKTSNWNYCQKLCNPDELNRKVMNVELENIDPFIVRRMKYLLKDIELRDVQKASPGAATFYVWVNSLLRQTENADPAIQSTNETKKDRDSEATGEMQPRPAMTKKEREELAKKEHSYLLYSIKKEKEIFEPKLAAKHPPKAHIKRRPEPYLLINPRGPNDRSSDMKNQ